jgi:hypothetical protein
MTMKSLKAAALAAVLGIAAIGSATASPVRPAAHANGTMATEVQYYGGGYRYHHYSPPPRHYHRHYNHYRYQPPHYRHHGGYHRY